MKGSIGPIIGIGGLVGLTGSVLTLGGGAIFGVVPGGIFGMVAAVVLGAAGSCLAARVAAASAEAEERWQGRPDPRRTAIDLEVDASVTEIIEAAVTLGQTAARMADGAIEQTGSVPKTTSTVESLYDRIDRISQNAEEAADATERTRQQALRGLEQIQGVIEGMDRLRAQVEANSRKARRLGERSEEIGTIVELIGEVSKRTDMLALNATIESVRAGEHGRGFAVVAEEIRKLAERTAAATREIRTIVEAMQADTHESIRALASEQAEMEKEASSVREAGSALERISRMAEDSARLVDGISHSANDQVLTTRELVTGMQRISEVSKRMLGETTQIRQEAQALALRCEHLKGPVGPRSEVAQAAITNRSPARRTGSSRLPRSIEAKS